MFGVPGRMSADTVSNDVMKAAVAVTRRGGPKAILGILQVGVLCSTMLGIGRAAASGVDAPNDHAAPERQLARKSHAYGPPPALLLAQATDPAGQKPAVREEAPLLRLILSSLKPPIAGQMIRLLVAVETGSQSEVGMQFVLRGAPDGVGLSHGRPIDQGRWTIDRIDIPELDITLPAKAAGPMELHLDLLSQDARILTSKSVAFFVEPAEGLVSAAEEPPTATGAAGAARPGSKKQARSPRSDAERTPREASHATSAAARTAPAKPALPPTVVAAETSTPRAGISAQPASAAAVAPEAATAGQTTPPKSSTPVFAATKLEPAKTAAQTGPETKAVDKTEPRHRLAARRPDTAPLAAKPATVGPAAGPPAGLPAARPIAANPPVKEPRELALGKATLATGNVGAARLLLVRAAEAGSAEGALLMGSSYDPGWLKTSGARGVVADLERALHWYELAQKLGAPEAAAKIASLPGN